MGNPSGNFLRLHKPAFKLSFFVKLRYLQKIYKNPTVLRNALHNLHGQILQTHCLLLHLNWSKELICLMCSGRSDHNCGER